MFIEGKNSVYEALNSDATCNKLLVNKAVRDNESNKIIQLAKDKHIRIDFVDKQVLDRMSESKNHQGFIAEVTEFKYCEVEDILKFAEERKEDPFIVILDGIEDPHNLGNIIRSCEGMGVHGIIIGRNRACAVNGTVIKVSSGAANYMKIARVTNINAEIDKLKSKNIWVYATDMKGESIYTKNLTGAIALVIGGEGDGISALTLKKCDGVISIPMKGRIESLNAGVSAGIVVYEILRQRSLGKR